MPDIVAMVGGRNAFGVAGKHSPRLSWASLANQNPEVLVIMPCGFDLARTRIELRAAAGKWGKTGGWKIIWFCILGKANGVPCEE